MNYFFFGILVVALATVFFAIGLVFGEVDLAPSAFSTFAYVLAGSFFSAVSSFLDSEPIIFFKNAGSAMVLLLLVGDVRIVHTMFLCVKVFILKPFFVLGVIG